MTQHKFYKYNSTASGETKAINLKNDYNAIPRKAEKAVSVLLRAISLTYQWMQKTFVARAAIRLKEISLKSICSVYKSTRVAPLGIVDSFWGNSVIDTLLQLRSTSITLVSKISIVDYSRNAIGK